MNEKTFEMTMLLDFYGPLLTEKQRECFHLHYNEDLSLAEIAEIMQISRQGVHDLLARAQATMEDMEAKIGLVKRETVRRACTERLRECLSDLETLVDSDVRETLKKLRKELEGII